MRPVHFVVAGILLMAALPAVAATDLHDASATYSGLLEMIRTSANSWSVRLRGFAVSLFWKLALIQLVLTMTPLVFKRADMGEILGEFVRYIMITGFFAALLVYSVEWAEAIVNSFRQAGASAAGVGVGLKPGDVLGTAVELASMVGKVETWNPAVALGVMIPAAIILLCFAFLAAFMGLTLIESYIVINASVLLMAFGGLQYTREYAMAMVRYSFSVGVKLFTLTLLIGLTMDGVRMWKAAYTHDDISTWTLLALALIVAYFCKYLSEMMQALINGVSPGGGSIIGGMAAAAVAGATAGVAAATAAVSSFATSSGFMSGGAKGVADLLGSSATGGTGQAASSMMNAAAGAAGSAFSGGSGGYSPPPSTPPSGGVMAKAQKVANMAHKAASGAVRSTGVLSAISVPGMESSVDLSMGPPPMPPDTPPPPAEATPENIIRPEDLQSEAKPQAAPNNKGKQP